ncbi:MAG: hypothetical protein Q7T04_04070 [Dehalococcoidia bacterium]|nr:hypothetical protein [Dehalococcoidia bacterium]
MDVEKRNETLASGNSLYQFGLPRAKDSDNYYGARVEFLTDQRVVVVFEKRIAGTRTQVGSYTTVSREKHAANVWFWVRAQAQGKSPTTLRIKVWRDGTPEPAAWDYQRTDSSTSLQGAGGNRRAVGDAQPDQEHAGALLL